MGMWSDVSKSHSEAKCTHCGKVEVKGQWWYLNDYFGVNGYFCPICYDLVSHDPFRKPQQPEQYRAVLVAQQIQKSLTSNPH